MRATTSTHSLLKIGENLLSWAADSAMEALWWNLAFQDSQRDLDEPKARVRAWSSAGFVNQGKVLCNEVAAAAGTPSHGTANALIGLLWS